MAIDLKEFKDVSQELISDVESALKLAQSKSDGFERRTYIRSFFAMVEGIIYQLKKVSIQFHNESPIFNPYELEILKEKTSSLCENGSVTTSNAKLKFLPNLTFAINSAIKAFDLDLTIDKNNGWEYLKKSKEIRDRISHPKGMSSLIITNQEIEILGKANIWFRDLTVTLLGKVHQQHRVKKI